VEVVLRRAAQRTLASRHHPLAPGRCTEVEICNILDDHARVCIASLARLIFTGAQVWQVFLAAFGRWGLIHLL
jgi:hypothetical protein